MIWHVSVGLSSLFTSSTRFMLPAVEYEEKVFSLEMERQDSDDEELKSRTLEVRPLAGILGVEDWLVRGGSGGGGSLTRVSRRSSISKSDRSRLFSSSGLAIS